MNKLYKHDLVGTVTPVVYTTDDATATAVVIKAPASTVTLIGRDLSRSMCGTTPAQRAALAALAMADDLIIVNPTVGQITRLYEISLPTLNKARALPTDDARFRVAAGVRPLQMPQDRMEKVVGEIRTVADAVELVLKVGPALFLDALDVITAPLASAAE